MLGNQCICQSNCALNAENTSVGQRMLHYSLVKRWEMQFSRVHGFCGSKMRVGILQTEEQKLTRKLISKICSMVFVSCRDLGKNSSHQHFHTAISVDAAEKRLFKFKKCSSQMKKNRTLVSGSNLFLSKSEPPVQCDAEGRHHGQR